MIRRTSLSSIKYRIKKPIERNGRGRNYKNDKNADSGIRDILSGTWIGVLLFLRNDNLMEFVDSHNSVQ